MLEIAEVFKKTFQRPQSSQLESPRQIMQSNTLSTSSETNPPHCSASNTSEESQQQLANSPPFLSHLNQGPSQQADQNQQSSLLKENRDGLRHKASQLLQGQIAAALGIARCRLPPAPWDDFLQKNDLVVDLPPGWSLKSIYPSARGDRMLTAQLRRLVEELSKTPPGVCIRRTDTRMDDA
jgi:hypothetical protein